MIASGAVSFSLARFVGGLEEMFQNRGMYQKPTQHHVLRDRQLTDGAYDSISLFVQSVSPFEMLHPCSLKTNGPLVLDLAGGNA